MTNYIYNTIKVWCYIIIWLTTILLAAQRQFATWLRLTEWPRRLAAKRGREVLSGNIWYRGAKHELQRPVCRSVQCLSVYSDRLSVPFYFKMVSRLLAPWNTSPNQLFPWILTSGMAMGKPFLMCVRVNWLDCWEFLLIAKVFNECEQFERSHIRSHMRI